MLPSEEEEKKILENAHISLPSLPLSSPSSSSSFSGSSSDSSPFATSNSALDSVINDEYFKEKLRPLIIPPDHSSLSPLVSDLNVLSQGMTAYYKYTRKMKQKKLMGQ